VEKTGNVLVLEFEGIHCEICGQKGQIKAIGKAQAPIENINLDTVQLKCSYCQTEYMMPVFFLVLDRGEAEKKLSLIQDIESSF
jgi:hypothetical protein